MPLAGTGQCKCSEGAVCRATQVADGYLAGADQGLSGATSTGGSQGPGRVQEGRRADAREGRRSAQALPAGAERKRKCLEGHADRDAKGICGNSERLGRRAVALSMALKTDLIGPIPPLQAVAAAALPRAGVVLVRNHWS